MSPVSPMMPCSKLHLYIDGPFHSPFERLLEQQVSVCIANGVGWTAFSSVFQQITNNGHGEPDDNWWTQWREFVSSKPKRQAHRGDKPSAGGAECSQRTSSAATTLTVTPKASHPARIESAAQKLSNETKLHLLIIVTSIEQLKPFFGIVMKYFERLRADSEAIPNTTAPNFNPVTEITAYVTRSEYLDPSWMWWHRDLRPHDEASRHQLTLADKSVSPVPTQLFTQPPSTMPM